jgi:hypothetical protein
MSSQNNAHTSVAAVSTILEKVISPYPSLFLVHISIVEWQKATVIEGIVGWCICRARKDVHN